MQGQAGKGRGVKLIMLVVLVPYWEILKSLGQLTPMPGPTSAVSSEAFLINKHIK